MTFGFIETERAQFLLGRKRQIHRWLLITPSIHRAASSIPPLEQPGSKLNALYQSRENPLMIDVSRRTPCIRASLRKSLKAHRAAASTKAAAATSAGI